MAEVKLTKNEWRTQQSRLRQLEKYLPTLKLKKALLQIEVQEAQMEVAKYEEQFQRTHEKVLHFAKLLGEQPIDFQAAVKIAQLNKRYENLAGVDVPFLEGIAFEELTYSLLDTPPWVDSAVIILRAMVEDNMHIKIAQEKKAILEKEWREVSTRVNLFEKVLIPRALAHLKKIKVFLGDQQLAAVSQAKVAKRLKMKDDHMSRETCAMM